MRDYFSVQLSLAPWWRWWYSVVKISTKTKSNMKICASFSYHWRLEMFPSKIFQQLFLIKMDSQIWDNNSPSPLSLQAFTFTKRSVFQSPKKCSWKIWIANFLADSASTSHSVSFLLDLPPVIPPKVQPWWRCCPNFVSNESLDSLLLITLN